MLKSLFGDLSPATPSAPRADAAETQMDTGFAATALMESLATEIKPSGQMVDRLSSDLVVTGSPAAAIRERFANTRADLDTATKLITLIDPVGVWASQVISALSEACGQQVERLHLREQTTLRTLATIERTTVVRQFDDMLKVVHADVRAPGRENAEIQVALMERSHMTAVIIGPMQSHAIDALLLSLYEASQQPSWRCPTLLFMLPPNAAWIAGKVRAVRWPASLQIQVIDEPLISASVVWNALVGQWRLAKAQQARASDVLLAPRDQIHFADSQPAALPAASAAPATPRPVVTGELPKAAPRLTGQLLDPVQAREALAKISAMDGLLGCAVVNAETSQVIARYTRPKLDFDIDKAVIAAAQLFRAHRQAALALGLTPPLEEMTTSTAGRQIVIRPVQRRPGLFMLALLDKQRTNLTLARFRLIELDRGLG